MPHTADQRQPPQAITPVSGPVHATISVPGSKSLTNRALCLAALASGTSTLRNALFSDDTHYFAAALQALGLEVRQDSGQATISVDGRGGMLPEPEADLFVGLAGTAARFLTALLALGSGCYTVDGAPRMRERPMEELLSNLAAQGARISADTQPVAHAVHDLRPWPGRRRAAGFGRAQQPADLGAADGGTSGAGGDDAGDRGGSWSRNPSSR